MVCRLSPVRNRGNRAAAIVAQLRPEKPTCFTPALPREVGASVRPEPFDYAQDRLVEGLVSIPTNPRCKNATSTVAFACEPSAISAGS